MLKVSARILGTDISAKNFKNSVRSAEDFAVKFHRKKYMPLHFHPVARLRYPNEYRKTAGKYTRSPGASSRQRGNERRNVNRERRMQKSTTQANPSEASKVQRKRPIYDSGLTELKVLRGGVKLTGRFDKRGITYNVPFYIKISAAGQVNKVNALNAINKQEETTLTKLTERKFIKEFEKTKTNKRG